MWLQTQDNERNEEKKTEIYLIEIKVIGFLYCGLVPQGSSECII